MVQSNLRSDALYGLELGPGDLVVDVGCGGGHNCAAAGQSGADVIGIDVVADCLELASERMRSVPARSFRTIESDCNPIPLPDGIASAVICTEVLEHVDDPPRLVAELARIGAPGAQYLVSVPDAASEAVMRAVAPRWYFQKPIHQHTFERGEIEHLLASAGLRVEAQYGTDFRSAMRWYLLMASGECQQWRPEPEVEVVGDWDRIAATIESLPLGPALVAALDHLMPKSRVILARKGSGASLPARSRTWRTSRLKRWFRDGQVRLGRFDLRWSVRRAFPRSPHRRGQPIGTESTSGDRIGP